MRYVKAAFVGVLVGLLGGLVVGIGHSFYFDEQQDAAMKDAFYAAAISESISTAALLMAIAVPAALLAAYLLDKRRETRITPGR